MNPCYCLFSGQLRTSVIQPVLYVFLPFSAFTKTHAGRARDISVVFYRDGQTFDCVSLSIMRKIRIWVGYKEEDLSERCRSFIYSIIK